MDDFGPYRSSVLSYSAQGSLDWEATLRDKVHLDANWQGPDLIPLGRRTGTSAVNLVWRHTVSAKLVASFTARGVLQDSRLRTTIRTPLAIGVNDRVTDTRAVFIGLAYSFDRKTGR
jgi:hypothetical protein